MAEYWYLFLVFTIVLLIPLVYNFIKTSESSLDGDYSRAKRGMYYHAILTVTFHISVIATLVGMALTVIDYAKK